MSSRWAHLQLLDDALELLLADGAGSGHGPFTVDRMQPRLVALVQIVGAGGLRFGRRVGQIVQVGGEAVVLRDADELVLWTEWT